MVYHCQFWPISTPGGGHKKPIYQGDWLKRGAYRQFADLRGALGKKEGGVLRGGWLTPKCILWWSVSFSRIGSLYLSTGAPFTFYS